MVADYEAAWLDLGALLTSKPQWGQRELLAEMARIAEANRVPAGELSRLLRLHGVEVERTRRENNGDDDSDSASDSVADGTGDAPTNMTEGGHGGRQNRREAAAATA